MTTRLRIQPSPCNGCQHASYTAPFGQLWSSKPEMRAPHVQCRLYGKITLEVREVATCGGSLGPAAEIVAAFVPAECAV